MMKGLTRNVISIDSLETQVQVSAQKALVILHEATKEAESKVRNMLSRIDILPPCNPLTPPGTALITPLTTATTPIKTTTILGRVC
ncbi:unnamed protein product [Rotaria sp. Silwood2]|nr:unnamed protein product [Rotaria sp. Silwood2]CAF2499871.1 unnamed protein product [Rotaria sp. Silwood2]CAF3474109.1 unnamed protein product [Rotaria sp. Silwood2]CAF4086396.1 unnamed protein product [Rotaria sp. Silwood2]CAF4380576.1 unnamed protein product [Rotaria sp. Silwood2]